MLNLDLGDLCPDVVQHLEGSWTMLITSILSLIVLISIYRSRRRLKTPRLQGPRSESFIFGNASRIFPSNDLSSTYRDWERMYGPVYQIPASFGASHVVLNDPKALTYLFSKDTITYNQPPAQWLADRKLSGDILIATEGETHNRIRRVLSSPLSVTAIRNLTPIVLDYAYQLTAAWDSYFQSSDKSSHTVEIDIVKWMCCFTMDNIGKAIMSHDFGNLKGHACSIIDILDEVFRSLNPADPYVRFTAYTNDILYKFFKLTLPKTRDAQSAKIVEQLRLLSADFLTRARSAPEDSAIHESVLGVMLKSVNTDSNIRLSLPEFTAQGMLVMAGFETTAVALTWSLIELARRPEIQETLRAELSEYLTDGQPPTYDQLTKDLKYLDAFVSEILRFHPSDMQISRVAAEDDVIPLADPIRTASGEIIDNLPMSKGTIIRVPLGGVNISEALWGPDAGRFDPDRWLNAECLGKGRKEQLPGYRHLLTFGAGPRLCPGRDFAILEIKGALVVLVSHFNFEFPNGPLTELSWYFGRPKVASEDGPKVPLLVRRLKHG